MKKIFIKFFLWYLRTLARLQLKKIKPVIIGIGGASGKSSLTHITSLILSQKYEVKTGKGKNSETGIPLNILNLDIDDYSLKSWLRIAVLAPFKLISDWKKYDLFVVEMGIDSPSPPKNMSYLLSFIKPKISVLTNIYVEHAYFFDGLSKSEDIEKRKDEIIDKISDQEKLLLSSINSGGRAIVNLDDPKIKETLPLNAKTFTVSAKDKDADFYISKIQINEDSLRIELVFLKEVYELVIPTPLPRYYAYIFVFAIAIAFSNEINIRDSIKVIEDKFELPPGRFSRFKGIKNSTIFDSSYNSSLEACIGAMETLSEIGKEKRKIGILGDMRELGSLSKVQHEILAKEIQKNLDFAILIGPDMMEFVSPVLEKGNFESIAFETFKSALDKIPELIKRDDLVLVKGSQNTLFLERAVEALLANKEDVNKLPRRGKYWDKTRRKSG